MSDTRDEYARAWANGEACPVSDPDGYATAFRDASLIAEADAYAAGQAHLQPPGSAARARLYQLLMWLELGRAWKRLLPPPAELQEIWSDAEHACTTDLDKLPAVQRCGAILELLRG